MASDKRSISLLDLFLLVLTVFEVFLLVVVLSRSFANSVPPSELPSETEEQTRPSQPDDEPTPQKPVFSQGAIPTRPAQSDTTKTLTTELDSRYAVLIDAESGEVIAQKGMNERFAPASMTKVMTLIVACEQLTEADLDRYVTMTEEILQYVSSGGYKGTSRASFDVGDGVKIRDLLYGVGVQSFADCTMMLVCAVCPADTVEQSERTFVELMNRRATEMGLIDTHFDNTVGYESENNYSTAVEIGMLMAYGLECPMIKDVLSAPKHEFYATYKDDNGLDKEYRITYYSTLFNSNPQASSRVKAYEDKYGKSFALAKGVLGGGKTGTLGGSGGVPYTYSLVSYAMLNGKLYVAVTGETTKGYAVMSDAKVLYDNYKSWTVG